MPANFKTYEAQARLLASVLAAHPDLKLNYKAIAQHYGKSQTTSAIEHRFRPLRSAAKSLRELVEKDLDPELWEDIFDKDAVAKYFGESTADGIQFQFRSIKQSAEVLKNAADNDEDPVAAFNAGKPVVGTGPGTATTTTPTKPTPRKRGRVTKPTIGTPQSDKMASSAPGTKNSSAKSRRKTPVNYEEDNTNDETSSAVDYSELDSPTKHVKKIRTTPLKFPALGEPTERFARRVPASPQGYHPITIGADSGTSPSESSALTPDDNEVTFLKQEPANNNPAMSIYPSFAIPAPYHHQQHLSFSQQSTNTNTSGSGNSTSTGTANNSFHMSNPGSFTHPGPGPSQSLFGPGHGSSQSLFGPGPRAHPPPSPSSRTMQHGHNNGQASREANLATARANLNAAFGGQEIDWRMSNDVIFANHYGDNAEI